MDYKKATKKTLEIIVLVLLLLAFFWFYENIYYPAKLSVKVSCQEMNETQLNDLGYYTAGTYNYTSGNITINLTYITIEESKGTLKHEHCHQIQHSQGRSAQWCRPRYFVTMNEVECYFSEYLPDCIYKLRYGDY